LVVHVSEHLKLCIDVVAHLQVGFGIENLLLGELLQIALMVYVAAWLAVIIASVSIIYSLPMTAVSSCLGISRDGCSHSSHIAQSRGLPRFLHA
jgi:hypothetical protein|tara:strand:- start:241 stop:522 length:282 start_codon:yes stop_codon:yes gene_type:complete